MIGQTLLERPGTPWGAIVCLLIAGTFLGFGISYHSQDLAIFAALPLLFGTMLLIGKPRPFQAELADSELVLQPSGLTIPYQDLIRVTFVGLRREQERGVIYAAHRQGVVRIPSDVGASSLDLYYFLTERMPGDVPLTVHPSVHDFHQAQSETFGSDRVWAHPARSLIYRNDQLAGRYLWLAALLTALFWLAVGTILNESGWIFAALGMGVMVPLILALTYGRTESTFKASTGSGWLLVALLFGPLGLIVYSVNRSSKSSLARKLSESSLIISPVGLALAQGELLGEMRWAELQEVRHKPNWLGQSALQLQVEGATVEILDIYDTPLVEIRRQIEHYWNAG